MDLDRIEELIDLMRRAGVMQLSLELAGSKVSITRSAGPRVAAGEAEVAAPVVASRTELPAAAAQTEPTTVVSPVVGLFRNGSGPTAGRATSVGNQVKRGALLAVIEAMKVPNEVRSPTDGVVSAILVEDGGTVEYGQALFTIQPEEGSETDESEMPVGLA